MTETLPPGVQAKILFAGTIPVVCFSGPSKTGKTCFAENLVSLLAREFQVAALKHTGHDPSPEDLMQKADSPKDTARFIRAGAGAAALAWRAGTAVFPREGQPRVFAEDPSSTPEEAFRKGVERLLTTWKEDVAILEGFGESPDVIIAEGFKSLPGEKLPRAGGVAAAVAQLLRRNT